MHGSGLKRTNHRDIQRRHRGGAAADRMTAVHRCPNLEGLKIFVRVQVPMQNQRKKTFYSPPTRNDNPNYIIQVGKCVRIYHFY